MRCPYEAMGRVAEELVREREQPGREAQDIFPLVEADPFEGFVDTVSNLEFSVFTFMFLAYSSSFTQWGINPHSNIWIHPGLSFVITGILGWLKALKWWLGTKLSSTSNEEENLASISFFLVVNEIWKHIIFKKIS